MTGDNFDIVTDFSEIPEVLRLVVLAILNAPQPQGDDRDRPDD